MSDAGLDEEETAKTPPPIPAPFEIKENVIYDPPHVSPRIRAQDGVLLACHQPLQDLEEKDCLEIIIKHEAHDDIRRRLDQYGGLSGDDLQIFRFFKIERPFPHELMNFALGHVLGHRRDDADDFRPPRAGGDGKGAGQQKIPHQNRGLVSEYGMGRRRPPPQGGAVHEIVMKQGGGVQVLEDRR